MTILRSLADRFARIPAPSMESIIPLRARRDLTASPSEEKLNRLPEFLQVLPVGGRHIIWFRILDVHGSCGVEGCLNKPTIWGLCREHL